MPTTLTNRHDLAFTAPDRAAMDAFDHAVAGYVTYRADTGQRIAKLIDIAPDFAMAHVLKGAMTMLGYNAALVPVARAAADRARALASTVTGRERRHLAALDAWISGHLDRATATWVEILDAEPRDILAFRLHHFVSFWLGRPHDMRREAERAVLAWDSFRAEQGAVLACRCFAREETGDYANAERDGRRAVEIEPGDLWAAHAVAHIMEMQGRHDDGIAWLNGLEANWGGANNLRHHLFWHRGLYHFERGEFATVLDLYDRHFRDLASPLVLAQPDLYIDVQNAASMLFRLERQGVDVGARWTELADKAEARIGDCLSTFTLPHWMMALAATRRFDAAERMIAGMEAFVRDQASTTTAPLVRDYALPISHALLARAQGNPAAALTHMQPALAGMHHLGGSHAQQDVLEQLYLDCALAAGSHDDVDRILAHVTAKFPVPPAARRGYAHT
jgi:hypothetical protein